MLPAIRPIVLTVVFGLLCGLLFLPFMSAATLFLTWRAGFRLALVVLLACYAVGLAEWSGGPWPLIALPLVIVLGLAVLERSHTVFLLAYLGLFAVIRSSLCQPGLLRTIALEGLLCLGGGLFVYSLNPRSNAAWALGIWIFFLIQALYFAVYPSRCMASPMSAGK
jgi:hypothetical protein